MGLTNLPPQTTPQRSITEASVTGSRSLKGVDVPAFPHESSGDTEESVTKRWDRFEACFLLSMADTDGLCLPPGTGVKYSCIVECEHCHINLTEITVVCDAYPVYPYQWDVCSVWLFKPLSFLWEDVLQGVLTLIWYSLLRVIIFLVLGNSKGEYQLSYVPSHKILIMQSR